MFINQVKISICVTPCVMCQKVVETNETRCNAKINIIVTMNIILQCCGRTRNDQDLYNTKFQYCHTIKQQSLANNN